MRTARVMEHSGLFLCYVNMHLWFRKQSFKIHELNIEGCFLLKQQVAQ